MANNLVVTPDSNFRLLKCPIKLDDHNQITFATVSAQTTYFQSLPYLYDTNMSYIRKDGVLRISTTSSGNSQLTYEDILEYNYLMYQNTHYDTKWFYAYITDIKYINDGCTEVSIQTDYFQTWQFDIVLKNTFIEREHVNDDTIGAHTLPENVELGEYYSNGYNYISDLDTYAYMVCATTNPTATQYNVSTNLGGIPFVGNVYFEKSITDFENLLQSYRNNNHEANIYAVYMIPAIACPETSSGQVTSFTDPMAFSYEYNKPTTLNGYTPKNNKVKTFPYMYLLVSNNNGQSVALKWEHFTTTKAGFTLALIPTIGGNYKLTPNSYEAGAHNEQYALMGGKFPTLSWSKDLFTNWLSSNGVNLGLGIGASALQIIGGVGAITSGAGSPLGVGMVASGLSGVANSVGQIYQHSFDPKSSQGNVNGGDINVAGKRNGFYLYNMSIKYEYAKMIDDYFSAYGYKVNRIGTPHIHARTYWDYLKTINCNLGGNIPNNDLKELCTMFDAGITFWHNSTKFLDYTQTNAIL